MTTYLWVKLVHIVSSTLLFGTGLGTAFFMFCAWRSADERAFASTCRTVVTADWVFTTPAIIVQFATGLFLVDKLGIDYTSTWFITVVALYAFVGACWLPVVWIQVRVRNLVQQGAPRERYQRLMRIWVGLGFPAFAAVLYIFYLMVTKQYT